MKCHVLCTRAPKKHIRRGWRVPFDSCVAAQTNNHSTRERWDRKAKRRPSAPKVVLVLVLRKEKAAWQLQLATILPFTQRHGFGCRRDCRATTVHRPTGALFRICPRSLITITAATVFKFTKKFTKRGSRWWTPIIHKETRQRVGIDARSCCCC